MAKLHDLFLSIERRPPQAGTTPRRRASAPSRASRSGVSPSPGSRRATAIARASTTSRLSMWSAIDQPTTRRENKSSIAARNSHPDAVQIAVTSVTHVVFFDDDFLPGPEWLARVEALFLRAPDVVVVTGGVVAGDRGAFYDLPKSISERIDAGVKGELFWQFTAHLENDDNTYRFDTKGLYQQNDGTLTRRYLRRVLLLIEEQERLNMIEDEIIIFNNFKWRESQLQLDT